MTSAPSPTRRLTRFEHLDIAWDARVLEPRPWTALQSRWAAELLADAPPGRVLELCAGAGHIGLLAAELSGRDLLAVDLNPVAGEYVVHNAVAAGLGARVEALTGDLADVVPDERFALVLADPPWVHTTAVSRYPDDPVLAIDGGDDGLRVARAVLAAASGRVGEGGSLLVQLGDADQAAIVTAEAAALGWEDGGLRAGERGVVQRLVGAGPAR